MKPLAVRSIAEELSHRIQPSHHLSAAADLRCSLTGCVRRRGTSWRWREAGKLGVGIVAVLFDPSFVIARADGLFLWGLQGIEWVILGRS